MQNPTTHDARTEQETTDAPETIELALDITDDCGLEWLDHYGEIVERDEKPEAVVIESAEGIEKCEECRDSRVCYTLDGCRVAVPVCRDCLGGYEWVRTIRPAVDGGE
jgi:hypothetical protein